MKGSWLNRLIAIIFLSGASSTVVAQQDTTAILRAPATPLVVHDPYFSIWSDSDSLTNGPTRHWTGVVHALNGIVRVDGKNYRYLGNADRRIPALVETYRKITPTRTVVTMQSPEIELSITFLTPAFPDDLRVMARPITYVTWDVKSRDTATHEVALNLDADGAIATNSGEEPVVWSRAQVDGLNLLRVGTSSQPVLEKYGDNLRIDWGYFYIAVPQSEKEVELAAGNSNYRNRFVSTGHIPQEDDLAQPRMPQSRYPAPPSLSIVLSLGNVGATVVTRHVLLGYDDIYSVEYMHQKLQAYWHKEFSSFSELLKGAEHDYLPLTGAV
jgi:hypothetical protein